MDITPQVAENRQVVRKYDATGFDISGARHEGSVLIFPGETRPWPFSGSIDTLQADDFGDVFAADPPVEILLIGTGSAFSMVSADLRQTLRERGLGVECMDTGAACRTYNVLLGEERQVAAALLPGA